MTPDELRICNVVDTLIRKNRSFALWRIPGESPRFAMQTSGSARILYHIEELDEQSGFVIAPFHVSKQHPIVLIRPDIQKLPPDEETKVSYSMPAEQEFHHSETLVSFPENPKEDYSRRFNAFIEPLRRKQFEKLVLSRCQTIPADRANFSPAAAFLKATGRYKYSYVYLCHTPATGTWLGCTPEIILSGEKGKWHTVALAGTQPLQNGELPIEWDDKNREEQEYVAFYIRKQLQALGIKPTETPPIPVRAGELSHLRSDFSFPLPDNKKTRRTVETAPSHACRLRTAQRRDVSLYPGERRLRPELLFRLYRLVGPRREERSVCKLALHEHLARIICFICRRRHSCFFGDRKRMA